MRNIACLVVTLLTFSNLRGQETEKRGYIGVNLGTSYLLNINESEGRWGANVNLINAGYSFNNNIGITLKWMGAAHVISSDKEIGYGAILIGPMYSIAVNDHTYLDLKFASGLFWIVEQGKFFSSDPNDPLISGSFKQSSMRLSLSNFATGLALRHNFAKRWTLLFLTEYNSGRNSDFSLYISDKYLKALSANVGIAFRL